MLNSKLVTLGTLAVLTFGLAACSPDKKSDTWSVDAPEIALKSGSSVGFTDKADRQPIDRDQMSNLKDMSQMVLPANAEIVFPSLVVADPSTTSFSIVVNATCSFGDLKATEQKALHDVPRFSLLMIIPSTLTVTALSAANHYDCSLSLAVTNQIGSVETFTLPSIYVQSLDSVAGVSLESFDTHQLIDDSVPVVSYDDAHRFVLDQTSELGRSQVQLTCDLHSQVKPYSDLNAFHLNELLPLASPDDATWRQTCRLVITPEGHPENVRLSKRFVLARNQAALIPQNLGIPCAAYLNNQVFNFQIKNGSDQTQIAGLHVPKRLHALTTDLNSSEATYVDAALQTTIENTVTVTDANGKTWFEMKPGETKNITVFMDRSFDSHACPVDGYFTNFITTDATEPWWPAAHPGATQAELLSQLPSMWLNKASTTIEQTGHYKNLSDIQPAMKVVSDIVTPLPLPNFSDQRDPASGGLVEGSKLPTY